MITIPRRTADQAARQTDERNKGVLFKHCATFTDCINEISNTEIDNAEDLDVVMSMQSLIKYSDNYSKTSGCLWQYYRDEPNDTLIDSEPCKSQVKVT